MNKNDREIFQRNLMVCIGIIVNVYNLQNPIENLRRAQVLLKEAQDLIQGELNEMETGKK